MAIESMPRRFSNGWCNYHTEAPIYDHHCDHHRVADYIGFY